jgi:hypothetical protein
MSTASSSGSRRRRAFQFTAGTLLVAMAWVGLATAAIANPSRFWAGTIFTVTLLGLFTIALIFLYRRGAVRAFAAGFTVFGGGFLFSLLLVERGFDTSEGTEKMPTNYVVNLAYQHYRARMIQRSAVNNPTPNAPARPFTGRRYFNEAAQCILTVLFGAIGGAIAQFLYLTRTRRTLAQIEARA